MDELQAGVLMCLLPYIDELNDKRLKIWGLYKETAGPKIQFLDYKHNNYVAHLAVILTHSRNEFITFMGERGIKVDIHYPILDCDQAGWNGLPMRTDDTTRLKISRQSVKKIVSLPCFPMLMDSEIEQVCQALADWEKN